jgi:hypothetical protein
VANFTRYVSGAFAFNVAGSSKFPTGAAAAAGAGVVAGAGFVSAGVAGAGAGVSVFAAGAGFGSLAGSFLQPARRIPAAITAHHFAVFMLLSPLFYFFAVNSLLTRSTSLITLSVFSPRILRMSFSE